MALALDIPPDDLKVFLQEVESILELLDEDVIRLEGEADNEELLQEIFRAAHTLKGSSGMVGFSAMVDLTHKMEDLLDRVRKGTLAVTSEIVDALLMSLDGLKELRDELAGTSDSQLDVAPIIEALQRAASGDAPAAAANTAVPGIDAVLAGNPTLRAALEAAAASGAPVWRITVGLDPECEWKSVRLFQVLNDLTGRGELVASVPTLQEVEEERGGERVEALLAAATAPEALEEALLAIDDVATATIEVYEPRAVESTPASVAPPVAERGKDAGTAGPTPKIDSLAQTVRIDVAKLDILINLVGELVIDRTRVAQVSRTLQSRYKEDEQVRVLAETSTHIAKVVDVLHESMMQARMLPVGVIFSKFPRLVRDLAKNMDKQIALVVEGEDTEIDRSVIEEIKDPIIHLIRNSVDHGVESAEERIALGKSEKATVRLTARHGPGHVLITVADDGRGIDPLKIRDVAVMKGVISAEAAQRLSDSEAVALIFAPGFSTAAQTTEVSGRGVGMDIVRSKIESLNGSVEVDSQPGRGTTFVLRLPLTLATVRGLLVSAGGETYAIPLAYVREIVRPEATLQQTVGGRPAMQLRNMAMGVLSLAEMLKRAGVPSMGGAAAAAAAAASTEERDRGDNYVVVVRTGEAETDRTVALTVDELVDQQEIVVKSLSGHLGRARGIAGATILGDGQVALILDVPALIKNAQAPTVLSREAERIAA